MAVALWAAFACVRGKRRGGASASVREGGGEAIGRPRRRGFRCGALGCGGSGAGGLARAPLAGPVGAGWAGWPRWRLGLCLFFELEIRETVEKYILFLYRTYIYQNSQGKLSYNVDIFPGANLKLKKQFSGNPK